MELNVSNIQHFSVGDGPGIRTTVFLKGCNLHCPWCHNPETISPKPQELFFEAAGQKIQYGKQMSAEEVLKEVMEDKDFYLSSGGGVTIGGGEPLLQSKALAELLAKAKESEISTLIDTAGDVPWENFEHVKDVTDIFYFDFKTGSAENYAKIIGGNYERIYKNLCRLIQEGRMVHIRVPLIPDFNSSRNSISKICKKLRDAGVVFVDLLPFHRLGSAKYTALGKEYLYRDTAPQANEEIEKIAAIYRNYFSVTIEK